MKDAASESARHVGSNDPDVIVAKWRAIFPDLDYDTASIWTRMRRATKVLVDASAAAINPFELTVADFDMLAALYREPLPRVLTIAALAEATSRTHGSVSVHAKSMSERGLIKRLEASIDARLSPLQLTRKGVSLVEKIVPAIVAAQTEIMAELTRGERRDLATLLRKIGAPKPRSRRSPSLRRTTPR
jgi:DNA-binding MarR family transcriptional regulator